jgi:glycolate oxidase FAD binding subunit
MFATDPVGAVTAGGASPRTLLLGLEGVLADGTTFRSGSRVVKSVAGFDVHKLLIGSRGRLFAATRLHLRLRPRPRAQQWFRSEGLGLAEALASFRTLRSLAVPPAALHLLRTGAGWTLAGRFAGRASFVAQQLRAHALANGEPFTELHLAPIAGGEVMTGIVRASRVASMLGDVPADAPFVLHGGGRFELSLPSPAASDRALSLLPRHGVQAQIAAGAPARRGLGTPLDAGQQRVTNDLKRALDPHGVLV